MTRRTKITIGATLLLIAYGWFCWWVMYPEPVRYLPTQPTETERVHFKQRLKHHGLHHQVSIIYDYPEISYFIRGGKKCKF